MCFGFINLGISLPWFLNSLVLEGHCNYLLNWKTSENTEHGSIRTKMLMFVSPNRSEKQPARKHGSHFLLPLQIIQQLTENEQYSFYLQLQVSVMFYLLPKCLLSCCVDKALASEELLDWYQLLKEISQPQGFPMSPENHGLNPLKLRTFLASINWAVRQTVSNLTVQCLRQHDTSL